MNEVVGYDCNGDVVRVGDIVEWYDEKWKVYHIHERASVHLELKPLNPKSHISNCIDWEAELVKDQ